MSTGKEVKRKKKPLYYNIRSTVAVAKKRMNEHREQRTNICSPPEHSSSYALVLFLVSLLGPNEFCQSLLTRSKPKKRTGV